MVGEEGGRLATLVPAALETVSGVPFGFVFSGIEEGKKRCGWLAGWFSGCEGVTKVCGKIPGPAGGWVVGEEGGWLATLVPAGARYTDGFIVGGVAFGFWVLVGPAEGSIGFGPAGGWVVGGEGGWLATLVPAGSESIMGMQMFSALAEVLFCDDTNCLQYDDWQYVWSWNICSKGAYFIFFISSNDK